MYNYNNYNNFNSYNNVKPNYYFYINGYEGAKQFNVNPNETVMLVDTQNPYLYVKTANNIGQTTIETYGLNKLEGDPNVKKEEDRFATFEQRLKALEDKLGDKTNG